MSRWTTLPASAVWTAVLSRMHGCATVSTERVAQVCLFGSFHGDYKKKTDRKATEDCRWSVPFQRRLSRKLQKMVRARGAFNRNIKVEDHWKVFFWYSQVSSREGHSFKRMINIYRTGISCVRITTSVGQIRLFSLFFETVTPWLLTHPPLAAYCTHTPRSVYIHPRLLCYPVGLGHPEHGHREISAMSPHFCGICLRVWVTRRRQNPGAERTLKCHGVVGAGVCERTGSLQALDRGSQRK